MKEPNFKEFLISFEEKEKKPTQSSLKLDKYDRRALYLWDIVFKDDPYYQKRRKQLKVKAIKPKLTARLKKVKERLEEKFKSEIWTELSEKCLECGKCTAVCPTCFCFRLDDDSQKVRRRTLDSCFFHDFSEIAGNFKFLDCTAQRIYFWYYHKFVRIPEQYNLPGCVECGRCTKVCPAGIDLEEVLKKILQ